ncbi:aldo/keto reductase [Actinomadura alba]|uniref:Aldo/keto reductase n=1 Tax=Actinomadura alba TaxID=406431 RepID=A0ABR7LZM1_9ACTN|nr:aldo/keto reductase [Actinomadura alba]MBC6469994.1 aldo/keto reductase [Actinomadura alba]
MTETTGRPATASGEFALGGDLRVNRLGFGAMRITGPGIWGEPADRDEALRVLRRAVDLGINLIDTADSYGPYVSEELIAEALHPYPADLVIATKGGLVRPAPGVPWEAVGRPPYLRQCVEMSLRRLRLERIDLYQLHRPDPLVPLEDQVGVLRDLQAEGKIRHIGLSNVDTDQLEQARAIVDIVSVQNRFNITTRDSEPVLEHCEQHGIGFIPWFPLAAGETAEAGPLAETAARHEVTPAQAALAWLLHRSPVMLPIPGTSRVAHLEENAAAALISLNTDEVEQLSALA